MQPVVCLLTGGRSLRMGRNKAGLYHDGLRQAQWLADLVSSVVGPRVIELGGNQTGCDFFLDAGNGPARALHEAAISGVLGNLGVAIVLPVDLYQLEATGVYWFVREALRVPCVAVVDGTPSWDILGIPVRLLQEAPPGDSLRHLASDLRHLEVPRSLAPQFRDSDYPRDLPRGVTLD